MKHLIPMVLMALGVSSALLCSGTAASAGASGRTPALMLLPRLNAGVDFVTEEVKGRLVSVRPDQITVRNDDMVTVVALDPETRVRMGIVEVSMGELRTGMSVTVICVKQFHRRLATTIIVDDPVVTGSR